MHEAYPKTWQNRIVQELNLGSVGATDEVLKSVMIPWNKRIDDFRVITNAATSYTSSQVFLGKGPTKAKMRDIAYGPMRIAPNIWFPYRDININITALEYAHVNALSVGAASGTFANLMFTLEGKVKFWESFDFDVSDTTSDWAKLITAGGGGVGARSTTAVDDGFGFQFTTAAVDRYSWISKNTYSITGSSGEDWYLRCFVRINTSASSVTTTTTTVMDGTSPIICGVRNANTAFQLRLKGTQGDTDTYQIALNYPTSLTTVGTITGTTSLIDDRWYMLEGIIRKADYSSAVGAQKVELNTYLVGADGVIPASVSEGTAGNGFLNSTLVFDRTGKWGDQDGTAGTAYFDFFVDQVLLATLAPTGN